MQQPTHRIHPLAWFPPIVLALLVLGPARGASAQEYAPSAGLGYAPIAPTQAPSDPRFDRSNVPGPPIRPNAAVRPATWPGGAQADQTEMSPWIPPEERSAFSAGATPGVEKTPCEGSRIIARVGTEAILESDLAGEVNAILDANKDRIPAHQRDEFREKLMQQRLKPLIETKMIYLDARRTIPEESWPDVSKQLSRHFEETELGKMMQKAQCASARELDEKLRAMGTSLEREKKAFIERILAHEWVGRQVKAGEEPTYSQMMAYYRQHQDEFTTPARARWEELMVGFSKHPSKSAAGEAIARLGNRVCAGEPFAEVARNGSDGITASDGGQWKWTTKGALVCEALDRALFELPVGRLSPILESETGFHIIRVIEREDAQVAPFLEAQVEIKKKMSEERRQKQIREYLAKLQARTPVWTVFDQREAGEKSQIASPQSPVRR